MKRRSFGVIGTLALAGTFAMATGSAIAAPSIDLEEITRLLRRSRWEL